MIHRDLKPANVMVGAFGEVQVMDWGLAKVLGAASAPTSPAEVANEATRAATQISPTPEVGSHTQAGSLLGTPAFAPPEQVGGEIEKVGTRADVFGLGAILAVILTGKPPYVGETAESVRSQALRGKLDDCFARLAGCGAEPELVALCRRCLAFEPADRPANAGEVAKAVAALRAAADERARRAELERVRVEGEQATAEAKATERRKRRRLWLGASAALVVAVVGGLSAVLAVQRQANANLLAKNAELDAERDKVQARFDMAIKAIETFHTGVSEDEVLKNDHLKELRTKLLTEAAGFYAELEKLLAGQTDAKSRKTLAAGYSQLAELTANIGDQKQALALHRKALALRQELAAAPGAEVATRLDVARSLWMMGVLLQKMGNSAEARVAHEEQRDLAEWLEALAPTDAVSVLPARAVLPQAEPEEVLNTTDAVQTVLAHAHRNIGNVLYMTARFQEALDPSRKALAIYQKLAEANPGIDQFRHMLAGTYSRIGVLLPQLDKSADGLKSHREAVNVMQKLADANHANIYAQKNLAYSYDRMSETLLIMGRPADAVEVNRKALAIRQKLVADHPAVTDFQYSLAVSYDATGWRFLNIGKPAEGVAACRKAADIMQKLIDDNPANTQFQRDLANFQTNIGRGLTRQKRLVEALAKADLNNDYYCAALGESYTVRGGAQVRAGQPAEAAAELRRALELYAKLRHLYIEMQVDRSRALALLAGLGTDAKSGVTAAEAKTFADQSVAALAAVVKAGWALPSELKEPDFDALRGRADFQKLVAEVEAKAERPAKPAPPEEKK